MTMQICRHHAHAVPDYADLALIFNNYATNIVSEFREIVVDLVTLSL